LIDVKLLFIIAQKDTRRNFYLIKKNRKLDGIFYSNLLYNLIFEENNGGLKYIFNMIDINYDYDFTNSNILTTMVPEKSHKNGWGFEFFDKY